MIQFILNNKAITTEKSSGMTLLDFIRYEEHLKGTKIGCREGDCGACTVLIGELEEDKVNYKSVTSCLTPLGNVSGKHVVTIEGLNMKDLSPVQSAMVEESGTQCGFCTVGFVVSFSALCFTDKELTYDEVISGIDGNICRCTGYKSIERAANRIQTHLNEIDKSNPVKWLTDNSFIPAYFGGITDRLRKIGNGVLPEGSIVVGGGTDLYVQKHQEMEDAHISFVSNNKILKGIELKNGICSIGGGVTVSEMMDSEDIQTIFPEWIKHLKLISSTPIRNIGTIAGNFVNASPIGDLTSFFLALNSKITLKNINGETREIFLKDFYIGYKQLDKSSDEIITGLYFPLTGAKFNFEKVSKRTYLDIASVNTAVSIVSKDNKIIDIHLSAGGVAPIPMYLSKTREFLLGKDIAMKTLKEVEEIIQTEISPISDVRGTENYKRLLMKQLFFAHFVELFPETFKEELFA